MYAKRIGESEERERETSVREPASSLTLPCNDPLHIPCSPSSFFSSHLWPFSKVPRKSYEGEKEGRVGASGNFSCAKYHADWLEVMKFWWLIKCKKIYRLCHLSLSLSLSLFLSCSLSFFLPCSFSFSRLLVLCLLACRPFAFSVASLHLDLPSSTASRDERKRADGGNETA